MRHSFFTFMLVFLFSISSKAQHLDTLVDVGGYKLHFSIMKGEGIPILFEESGTFVGPPWNGTLELIHQVTGTTLIRYHRAGFGKSELNPKETDDAKFGIINSIEELETGLAKLGYDGDIILVGHAYGAFMSTLYAARHPEKVRYVVMVNGLLADYITDERLAQSGPVERDEDNLGQYYLRTNMPNTVRIMRQTDIPPAIPVIDLVAGIPIYFMTDEDFEEWKNVHQDFVAAQPNRKGIVAHGSGHYIFKDNAALFVNTVVKAYAETLNEKQKAPIFNRLLEMNMELANEAKKKEMEYLHSEASFHQLGNALMKSRELEKALEVFKLNALLFPESWKVYDSYAGALLEANRKTEAIAMYEKSVALNPDNETGKKILEKIKQE